MNFGEYIITFYSHEHKEQVLNVLEHLWSYERNQFASQFEWKYEHNPNTDSVLGIVALYQDKVVGFRGYFVNRYIINGCPDTITILHPGDTCVFPEHQRKGLSVAMGKLAFQYDNRQFPLFMNTTCGENSFPGYIKMGFKPLEQKVQLRKWSINPIRLWRNRQTEEQRIPFEDSQLKDIQINNLLQSRKPLPEQMASVVEQQGYPYNKLCLYQDKSFFEWRYNNSTHKYLFYFLMEKDSVVGYVVLGISRNNQAAKILDYAQVNDNAITTLLTHIIKSRRFVKLSVYCYGLNQQVLRDLSDLGFSLLPPWKKILLKNDSPKKNVYPLLVRPTKESFSEQDFIINGLNVLDFKNWMLKPICSDSE